MSTEPEDQPEFDCDLVDMTKFLTRWPEAKWGFTIYRCTYKSDDQWNRFIENLNVRVKTNLEESGAADLYDRWDWNIQEDGERFAGASTQITRQHFQSVVRPKIFEGHFDSARCHAFLHVRQFDVDRILNASDPPNEFDVDGCFFLELVSAHKFEGSMFVGISYISPRIYCLLDGSAWMGIEPDTPGDVSCP